MSTEHNKEIVRRFVTEALSGRNLGLADEVLAPNYVNRMTGADLAAFKGMLTGMSTALSDVRFEIDDLVAEGDSVVARWKMEATHTGSLMGETPTGKRVSSRGLTYYRLVNGQIVEDDPMSSPDLLQALGIQMPA
ncbi:MAG TPA: ester cyclase [Pyrinomonadaceae bacterium]|jgi:predicted ester cyclase|nr:ester cyclase [Pyrinomonadaceae bacterium]